MAFRRQFLIFISYGEQMAGLHQCRRLSGMTAMRFPLRCHWSPHVPGVWWLGHGTSSWKNGSLFASLSHFVMVLANNLIFQVYVCTHRGSNSMDSLLSYSNSLFLCVWVWKHLKSFVMRGSVQYIWTELSSIMDINYLSMDSICEKFQLAPVYKWMRNTFMLIHFILEVLVPELQSLCFYSNFKFIILPSHAVKLYIVLWFICTSVMVTFKKFFMYHIFEIVW